MIQTYKDLIVWQKAVELTECIYEYTRNFPDKEMYSLTSQMRRAAISIPSNIAEGRGRGTRKDFKHFLDQAYGSACELETQIIISKRLSYGLEKKRLRVEGLVTEVLKMLNSMIKKLEAKS